MCEVGDTIPTLRRRKLGPRGVCLGPPSGLTEEPELKSKFIWVRGGHLSAAPSLVPLSAEHLAFTSVELRALEERLTVNRIKLLLIMNHIRCFHHVDL